MAEMVQVLHLKRPDISEENCVNDETEVPVALGRTVWVCTAVGSIDLMGYLRGGGIEIGGIFCIVAEPNPRAGSLWAQIGVFKVLVALVGVTLPIYVSIVKFLILCVCISGVGSRNITDRVINMGGTGSVKAGAVVNVDSV